MKLVRHFAFGFMLGLAACLAANAWLSTETSADDLHNILGTGTPIRIVGLHPSSGGSAPFTLCTTDPADAAVWRYGPSAWAKYMMRIQLPEGANCSGSSGIRTMMMWEYGSALRCEPGDIACWLSLRGDHSGHDFHEDVFRSYVVFNFASYDPLTWDWKSRIAAHEWGHAFSLRDHDGSSGTSCSPNLLMRRFLDLSQPAACVLNPNFEEICSVWENVYDYQDNVDGDVFVDGCDADADGDKCSNFSELRVEPISGGDRNPLDLWDYYSVTSDMGIDLADTQHILAHFGHTIGQDAEDHFLSRSAPDPAKPYRTAPGDALVDLEDALLNMQSFGHTCGSLP